MTTTGQPIRPHRPPAEPGHERPPPLAIAELGLAAAIVAAPVALGGVHPVTAVALAVLCVLSAWAWWAIRDDRRPRGGLTLAAAGLGAALLWTVAAIVPLPAGVLAGLSPALADLLDDPVLGEAVVHRLAFAPGAAMRGAVELAGALAVVWLVADLARSPGGGRRPVAFVVAAGVMALGIGAVQTVAGGDRLLGFYAPVDGPEVLGADSLFGFTTTFVNANHAAELFELAGLAALALGVFGRTRRRVWIPLGLLLLSGVVLTGSRAGLVATAAGLGMLGVLAGIRAGRLPGWSRWAVAAALSAALVALLSLGAAGALTSARPPAGDDGWAAGFARKMTAWPETWSMIAAHPWTGVGRGGFRDAHPHAMRAPDPTAENAFAISSPENVYLQLPAELGLPVGGALLLVVALTWAFALARWDGRAATSAALVATLAVAVHSSFDFALEFAGVGLPFTALIAVLAARPARGRRGARWTGLVVLLFASGALAFGPAAVRHGSYRGAVEELLESETAADDAVIERAIRWHPVSADVALAIAGVHDQRADPWASLRWLGRTMRLAPHESRAHELAAGTLVELGRGSQALIEIGLAFEIDRQHKRWRFGLMRSVGADLAAVRLTTGDAPDLLAGYALFLLADDEASTLARALGETLAAMEPVPPEAARVLARLEELDGDVDGAVATLRGQLDRSPDDLPVRLELARMLARHERGAEALTLLDDECAAVTPHPRVCLEAARIEMDLGEAARARRALRRVVRHAEPHQIGVRAEAYAIRGDLLADGGDLLGARDAYRDALRLAPGWRSVRVRLGDVYESLGQPDEALGQYLRVDAEGGGSAALDARIQRVGGRPGE